MKNTASITTLFFLLFLGTIQAQAQNFPPPPSGIDFCQLLPCLGGCPPVTACHNKSAEVEDLIQLQAGLIVLDGIISYISVGGKGTTYVGIDMINGEAYVASQNKGDSQYAESYFTPVNAKEAAELKKLKPILVKGDGVVNMNKAGGCSNAGPALISSVQAYMAAQQTGNSALISDALIAVRSAFTFFIGCQQV